jgi:hypothetical protein
MVETLVNLGLYLSYILLFVSVIGALVFPIIKLLDQPKVLIRTGIGIGVMLGIFLLSWIFSGDEVTKLYENFNVDATLSKRIGGTIIMMYILFFATIALAIYSEIVKFIK